MTNVKDKARGMLVGLAIGDALGAPVEFLDSSSVSENMDWVRKMEGGRRVLPKGVWTDDTSMAPCIADSILECGGYNSYDVMDKYLDWEDNGYRSYFNGGYGIGLQTQLALSAYRENPKLTEEQKTDSAGNGVIMRLAPIVIASLKTPNLRLASISARDTHYSVVAEAVAEMFASVLYTAAQEKDIDKIIKAAEADFTDLAYRKVYGDIKPLLERRNDRKGTSLKNLGGYCVDTLTIALWGLQQFDRPLYGMLGVISLGGDTDTNAAVYGQLAGAYYGYEALPKEWRENVYLGDEIKDLADKLLAMKECPIIKTRFE